MLEKAGRAEDGAALTVGEYIAGPWKGPRVSSFYKLEARRLKLEALHPTRNHVIRDQS